MSVDVDVISGPIGGKPGGGHEFEFESHPRPGRPSYPNTPDFGELDPTTNIFFRPFFQGPLFNSFGFDSNFGGLFPGFDQPQRVPWWRG